MTEFAGIAPAIAEALQNAVTNADAVQQAMLIRRSAPATPLVSAQTGLRQDRGLRPRTGARTLIGSAREN